MHGEAAQQRKGASQQCSAVREESRDATSSRRSRSTGRTKARSGRGSNRWQQRPCAALLQPHDAGGRVHTTAGTPIRRQRSSPEVWLHALVGVLHQEVPHVPLGLAVHVLLRGHDGLRGARQRASGGRRGLPGAQRRRAAPHKGLQHMPRLQGAQGAESVQRFAAGEQQHGRPVAPLRLTARQPWQCQRSPPIAPPLVKIIKTTIAPPGCARARAGLQS